MMYVIVVIAGILLLLALLPLIVKSEYSISREIIINRPKEDVFNYIKNLKNQEQFSKWIMMDPNMKKVYKGIDGTVGFVYAWEGNEKAGKGEQEIKGITEGETLDVEVRFEKPFKSTANTPFTTKSVSSDQTLVSWGMNGRSKYPMNIMNLFMDGLLGKDLEASLINLKNILEAGRPS